MGAKLITGVLNELEPLVQSRQHWRCHGQDLSSQADGLRVLSLRYMCTYMQGASVCQLLEATCQLLRLVLGGGGGRA